MEVFSNVDLNETYDDFKIFYDRQETPILKNACKRYITSETLGLDSQDDPKMFRERVPTGFPNRSRSRPQVDANSLQQIDRKVIPTIYNE